MTVKILHLYHDLMNLYGDWANPDILARALRARDCDASVHKKSIGDDINFDAYTFLYIGSGTERNQRACMRDLSRYKEALMQRINTGLYVLSTGNSHELFGHKITTASGKVYDALGLLDFETVQTHSRVTGDCICSLTLPQTRDSTSVPEIKEVPLIGFVNRAGGSQNDLSEIDRPFTMLLGPGGAKSRRCGIRYMKLLGTYMIGPVLVRNPPLLNYFAEALTGISTLSQTADRTLFDLQRSTYDTALHELSKRRK